MEVEKELEFMHFIAGMISQIESPHELHVLKVLKSKSKISAKRLASILNLDDETLEKTMESLSRKSFIAESGVNGDKIYFLRDKNLVKIMFCLCKPFDYFR